jgi:hydroxymethylglutaryl-CoA lyase
MTLPTSVKMVEVAPRDGLQNEEKSVPTDIKIEFINLLSETGLSVIEVTSFVSPKWIPQLADNQAVYQGITQKKSVQYPVLIPNLRGLNQAIEAGVKSIAVFTTASEQFSQHNTHASVAESLARIAELIPLAKKHKMDIRGYLSCVLGCPYEGEVAYQKTADLASQLMQLGCNEISLGDTIGVGTPEKTKQLIATVMKNIPREKIAVHFHDTYGQALANIYAALTCGVQIIDSSVAGLGGCPYAQGASGNVASEDVLYLLNGLGIQTGVNLEKLIQAGNFITKYLQCKTQSKVGLAWLVKSE